jgi:uncharacterized lipoprotein YajG
MEANRITTLRSKWTTGMAVMLLGATLVLSACAPTTPGVDAVTPAVDATYMAGRSMR